MDIFNKIAEQRIIEAINEGVFDNLSNKGKPLEIEDMSLVPEDLRMAYKILKNAGMIPPELEDRKEIIQLQDLIKTIDDDELRLKKIRELNYKLLKFNIQNKRALILDEIYEEKVKERLSK
ncbi:MAG: DUF1992 domain-containing protein [Thermodesulfovibrionales bacterium]|nr:DUF1992 domain-containing protein [Thermodesulfovibrionales bacterium]